MNVLGIESSCDETAAALLRDGRVVASVVASQISVHHDYGGVVPELASREHVENICLVLERCLRQAGIQWPELEAIAVTRGPGLMGSLLVGMAYAKALSYTLGIPFFGVNHLEGHMASVFMDHPGAELPALALVVSGGHTSLFFLESPARFTELARTRDDAAGEALDKLSKHLGLGYPGGPLIERLAPRGDPGAVPFAIPRISDGSLDFSFSGLKTAALRHLEESGLTVPAAGAPDPEALPQAILDLLASYQRSVIDQLIDRATRALKRHPAKSIQFSGGVSCNSELRRRAREHFEDLGLPVYFPRPEWTTDNAAMIAAAALRRAGAEAGDPWSLTVDPNLRAGAS